MELIWRAERKNDRSLAYCGTVNYFEKQATSEHEIVCSACGTANKKEFEHCVECGQSLYQNCPKCGTRNEADAIFCAKCGLNLEKALRTPRKYFEYLAEANRVSKEYMHIYRTFMWVGIAGMLISICAVNTHSVAPTVFCLIYSFICSPYQVFK